MKTMKVGNWYNKFDLRQQEYFKARVERYGTQTLRAFLTAAYKQFGPYAQYLPGLNVLDTKTGITYYWSSDRKDFNKLNNG